MPAVLGWTGCLPTCSWRLADRQVEALLDGWPDTLTVCVPTATCAAGPRAAGGYVFAENNPFLLDSDSFAKGRDLFRRGVLTGGLDVCGSKGVVVPAA